MQLVLEGTFKCLRVAILAAVLFNNPSSSTPKSLSLLTLGSLSPRSPPLSFFFFKTGVLRVAFAVLEVAL